MTDNPSRGFIPPRAAQPVSDQPPPIPVALPYFSDTAPTLLPLIRAIAFLMIVTAALRIISFPFYALDYLRFRPLAAWNSWYLLITLNAEVTLAVVSMVAGIACTLHPPRRRKLLVGWAWAALVVGAGSLIARIYFYVFATRPFPDIMGQIATDLSRYLASATLPVICLILARRRDVRQLFGEMTSA